METSVHQKVATAKTSDYIIAYLPAKLVDRSIRSVDASDIEALRVDTKRRFSGLVSHPARTLIGMRSLQDRELERTSFLMTIYEFTDGETMNETTLEAVADAIGVDRDHAMKLYKWAGDRGLTGDGFTLGGTGLALSAGGVDAVEDLLRKGASPPASVLVLSAEEMRAVEAFLTEYRRSDESGTLPVVGEERLELEAEVRTIEAQLQSPRPKRRVVKASLNEAKHLLRGAGGSALFTALLEASRLIL